MNESEKRDFNRQLRSLAVPMALQSLLQALVGASDALMLGRLSQNAVAAVSLANQISFVMGLFYGAAVGSAGILIAQYWGKKDVTNVRRFLSMALRYCFGIALIFFLGAFLIPSSLMSIFTSDPEIIEIGAEYLRIIAFSYLFSALSQCYLSVMKICGRAKISVYISVMTVVVDMSVDMFLIYGIGPFPKLGANGSAYSTVAVEAIAFLWCVAEAGQKDHVHPNRASLCFFSKQFEQDIWKIIPGMLASSLSWGLSISVHSFIMGHLGSDATAASSITSVAQQLVTCITAGLSGGTGVMIGELLGQDQFEKAKRYGTRFWKVSIANGLLNAVILAVVGPAIYVFYVLEPQAKTYLVQMLIFSAFYLMAYALNTIIVCGVFPAGGDAKYDAVSVLIATWCFAIPLSLLGLFVFHWPVIAVYCIMCSDEIIKLPFLPWRYHKYIWVRNLTRNAQ